MKIASIVLSLFGLTVASSSAFVINLYSGVFKNSSGVAVPDGTLFALVANTNADSTFGGGLTSNSSLTSGQASVFSTGQSIAAGGTLNGDTIFWVSSFNGTAAQGTAGVIDRAISFTAPPELLGQSYAIYFFPGATLTSGNGLNGVGTVGTQVGGINSTLVLDGGNVAMVTPATNAGNSNQGPVDNTQGGTVPVNRFQAVNLIPEPSSMMLGAVGALALLRRRRN